MSVRGYTNAQRFDQRVTFERNQPTQDGNGDPVADWHTLCTCWAAIDAAMVSPLGRGLEPYVNGATMSLDHYTIWVRSEIIVRFALTMVDRVRWRRKYFDVKAIPDQQLRGRIIGIIVAAGINYG